jgi:hypothetical protein
MIENVPLKPLVNGIKQQSKPAKTSNTKLYENQSTCSQ